MEERFDISVIYEDEYIVAINKPAHLVVHKGVKTDKTLSDWILENYPKLKDVGDSYIDEKGEKILRPGIVHRLDKETSGVMLIAKDKKTYETLKTHFKKGKIKKEYHSFVYNIPKKKRGRIETFIGRSKKNFLKLETKRIRGEAKEALTDYSVVGSCELEGKGSAISFVKFFPYTGRMHQIRVHSLYIKNPIVCDSLYAKGMGERAGFKRLALHSYKITIDVHFYDKPLSITAPYPEDFKNALYLCKI